MCNYDMLGIFYTIILIIKVMQVDDLKNLTV